MALKNLLRQYLTLHLSRVKVQVGVFSADQSQTALAFCVDQQFELSDQQHLHLDYSDLRDLLMFMAFY